MEKAQIFNWLSSVSKGEMTPEEALDKLEGFPYHELGYAKVDTHRHLRSGNSEVIYCPGKTTTQIVEIFQVLANQAQNVMATRASKQIYKQIQTVVPEVLFFEKAKIVAKWNDHSQTVGAIGIISAGTADLRVAEEASVTAELMGSRVIRIFDVGVAGIHRLFDKKKEMDDCRVLIVVAGMEGALASVIGGLFAKPIVAVPTSVGYGANFKGLAALLSMINSCAGGIGVVNIDNGFGAGVLAHRINLLGEKL